MEAIDPKSILIGRVFPVLDDGHVSLVDVMGPDAATCEKRQEPTAEEIAADRALLDQHMERFGKIRTAIVDACGGPWKKGKPSVQGTIQCPCCEGVVRFTRSGYNGHVHAACSTPNCASWIE